MGTELVPTVDLNQTMQLGEVLAKSGFFPDAHNAAKAVAKILAGREMGFGPIASLSDVHIIQGKPSLGAHLRAAAIKRSGKYDYDLLQCDSEVCELEFFGMVRGQWKSLGKLKVTMQELINTGVAMDGNKIKATYKKNPDDMLFARAISKGYRRYCPDLSGGVLAYDPEELEARESGPVEVEPIVETVVEAMATDEQLANIAEWKSSLQGTPNELTEKQWAGILAKRNVSREADLTYLQAEDIINNLKKRSSTVAA